MPTWFSPICDAALAKLLAWQKNYARGEVHSTCKYNDRTQGVIDKPTRYMHKLIWHPKEWEQVVRIMRESSSNQALVEELTTIQTKVIPAGQMVIGGGRAISLAFYPEHVDEIVRAMQEAKSGRTPSLAEEIQDGGLF